MAFFQDPPRLGNQFDDDPMLPSWIARLRPGGRRRAARARRPRGRAAIAQAARRSRQRADAHAVGRVGQSRRSHRGVAAVARGAGARRAARHGRRRLRAALGAHARTHQFALVHVLGPSLDVYSCPLAMTDGAARTLLASGNQALIDRYVPRLTSRDPATMWTSGQWMTERTGGSDVSQTETVARRDGDGQWRLYGTKWFTSATTVADGAHARAPRGQRRRQPRASRCSTSSCATRNGRLRDIAVNRLKDKLGTRKVPTAELTLDGAPATLVGAPSDGVRAHHADAHGHAHVERGQRGQRRCGAALALARDYARRRTRVRRAARRQAAARRHARDARGRVRGRVLPRVPQRRAARPARARRRRRTTTSGSRARSCRSRSSTTGKQAVAVDVGGDRGVRRRRLRRGHRPAAHPRRRAGAADLGGHDERAVARHAARARQGRRARGDRAPRSSACARGDAIDGLAQPAAAARAALAHASAWVAERDARSPIGSRPARAGSR